MNPTLTSVSPWGEGQQCPGACRDGGGHPSHANVSLQLFRTSSCAGATRPHEKPRAPRMQPGDLPHGTPPPKSPWLYPSCTPKGGTDGGWGGGQRGPRRWRAAGDTAVGSAAWQELLGWLPHGGATGRPATQPGQLPPLPRVRFLHSCPGTRAERGPGSGVPPHPAQPCGSPVAERIFMLSPGIGISVHQSNISQVFFLLATGMRSFGLGVLDVEKLLLGRGRAAVPGARALAPLDAGVVLHLPPVHVVLLHRPVCPETLVRGGDEAGDGEAARDLRKQTPTPTPTAPRGDAGAGGSSNPSTALS